MANEYIRTIVYEYNEINESKNEQFARKFQKTFADHGTKVCKSPQLFRFLKIVAKLRHNFIKLTLKAKNFKIAETVFGRVFAENLRS